MFALAFVVSRETYGECLRFLLARSEMRNFVREREKYGANNIITYAGIKEAKASTPAIDSTYYTLSGIRVTKPRPGIYIHDGKKKLMK